MSLAEPALSEKQKQILRCAQNDSEGLGMTILGLAGKRRAHGEKERLPCLERLGMVRLWHEPTKQERKF